MAKERLGSNAQFSSAGTLTVTEKCAYAYSELSTISDTNEHVLMQFQTGKYILKGHVTFYRESWESNDIRWYIKFNGIKVLDFIGGTNPTMGDWRDLIIPPLTDVVFYADKQEHSAESKIGVNFTGEVYQ